MSRARDLANHADGTISGALTTDGLTVDTTTLAVDASNNRIGIGTATPGEQLELLAGSERLMIGANNPSTFSRVAARNTGDSGYRGLKIDGSDLHLNTESGSGNIIMSTGSDKVGIGTATPAKKLDISGDSGDVVQAKVTYAGADGNRAGFILANTHTGGREYGIYAGNDSTGGGLGNSFGISDNTASTAYRLIIDSSGNVGIGIDAPSEKLDVGGTIQIKTAAGTHPAMRFMEGSDTRAYLGSGDWAVNGLADDDFGIASSYTGDFAIATAFVNRFHITNTGNIGIGETSPENILHIKTSASGGPQIELDSTSGTANSAFINFDGTSLQLSTQRDMVDGSKRDTAKSWGGINIVGPAAGSYIQLQTSSGNNNAVSTKMTIDKDGNVTTPSQPSFDVWGPNNNTGFNMIDGTSVTYTNWSTGNGVSHNTGNHFNTTTGIFTAPVAGRYFFNLQVMFRMNTSTYINDFLITIQKNGGTYIQTDCGFNDDGNGDGWNTDNCTVVMDMAANDTAQATYALYSSTHGTGATTNWYSYQGYYTRFCGHLLG